MIFKERQFQTDAHDAVMEGFKTFQRQLMVVPTGGGKTIIFSRLTKEYVDSGKRVLILAHREELLLQAQDKLHRSQGVISDLERADHRAAHNAPCVIGSIQTMYRRNRLERFPIDHFGLIIIDEAHRALADTYGTIIDYFQGAHLLGVTATPDRADKRNLSRVFQNVAYEVGLKELITKKFLCQIRVKTFPVNVDLATAESKSDYDTVDVSYALRPLLEPIATAFINEIKGRKKVLVFLPLRKISEEFVEILRGLGIAAEHIDGESKDRASRLHRFKTGETRVLCNAMLLTEGYDEPGIDAIMCLRPTKSRALYAQIIGRGTRTCEGKPNLLILDPMWMSESHSLIKPAHLVAETDEDARAIGARIAAPDDLPHLPEQDTSVDLMAVATDAMESRMRSIEKALAAARKKAARKFDPITYAIRVMNMPSIMNMNLWKEGDPPPTEKQLKALCAAGMHIEAGEIKSAFHASLLLDRVYRREAMGLATTKQLFYLHQLQIPNANSLTKSEAGAIMGERFGNRRRTDDKRIKYITASWSGK